MSKSPTVVELTVRDVLANLEGGTLLAGVTDDVSALGDPSAWLNLSLIHLAINYRDRAVEVLHVVMTAIDDDRSMRSLLALSGLCYHPDIVAALARALVGPLHVKDTTQ